MYLFFYLTVTVTVTVEGIAQALPKQSLSNA